MNIAESFAQYLEDESIATIGQDLFVGHAPSSNKVPDSIWWVEASGGDSILKAKTNARMKSYLVEVRYRNRNYQTVYNNIHTLEELLNSGACSQLDGFETIEIEATTFPVDDDLDGEDRKRGLLVANITIYKEY